MNGPSTGSGRTVFGLMENLGSILKQGPVLVLVLHFLDEEVHPGLRVEVILVGTVVDTVFRLRQFGMGRIFGRADFVFLPASGVGRRVELVHFFAVPLNFEVAQGGLNPLDYLRRLELVLVGYRQVLELVNAGSLLTSCFCSSVSRSY